MRWRWHPLLFAIYPVLFLYARNSGNLPVGVLTRPLVVAVAFGLVVWAASRLVTRDGVQGALLATGALVLWSAYGHVHELLGESFAGQHRVLLPVWVSLVVWLIVMTRRGQPMMAPAQDLERAAILLGVVLLAYPSIRIAGVLLDPPEEPRPYDMGKYTPGQEPHKTHPDADIYHIILDGYGRADILSELYNHDNTPFIDALRARGFCVSDSARANYTQTLLSLVRTLGGGVSMAGDFGHDPDSADRRLLARELKRVVRRGPLPWYCDWTRAFATGYTATEVIDADQYLAPIVSLNEFERALAATTPLGVLMNLVESRYGDWLHRRLVEFTFAHLAVAPNDPPRAFTFAHIIAPHPPFVFAPPSVTAGAMVPLADGDHVIDGNGLTIDQYRAAYRAQIVAVNERTLRTLDAILANGRASIILLHGDHGPGSLLRWEERIPQPAAARERLGILLAVRIPDPGPDICERAETPAGMRSELMACLWNTAPRESFDRSYFSTWSRPFDFVEIGPDGEVVAP